MQVFFSSELRLRDSRCSCTDLQPILSCLLINLLSCVCFFFKVTIGFWLTLKKPWVGSTKKKMNPRISSYGHLYWYFLFETILGVACVTLNFFILSWANTDYIIQDGWQILVIVQLCIQFCDSLLTLQVTWLELFWQPTINHSEQDTSWACRSSFSASNSQLLITDFFKTTTQNKDLLLCWINEVLLLWTLTICFTIKDKKENRIPGDPTHS